MKSLNMAEVASLVSGADEIQEMSSEDSNTTSAWEQVL
jgi:hypothetical protein